MNAQTAINFDAPDRIEVEVIDDPSQGYCKVYRWTRTQRRKLEQYRKRIDYSRTAGTVNGEALPG